MSPTEHKRIALFGGAFDPPHYGHALFVTLLLNSRLVEEIWVVPSGPRADKEYQASGEHRLHMVRLLLESCFGRDPRIKIDPRQLNDYRSKSATAELLRDLKREFPQVDFFVVVGSEWLKNLSRWADPEYLRTHARFLVIERLGEDMPAQLPPFDITVVANPRSLGMEVSSTAIRNLMASKESVGGLLPAEISEYIKHHDLYSNETP